LISLSTELWHVIGAYGVCLGVGIGFVYVPAVGPVQRWFVQKRGLASGLAVAGIGAGTFASPIIATEFIALWDWRTAFLLIAVGGAVIGLIGASQIISSPGMLGQLPHGQIQGRAAESSATGGRALTLGQAVRSRPFMVLYAASFLASFSLFIPFVHLVPSILDLNIYSKEEAVFAASMIGIGSLAGRFVMGPIADMVGRRTTLLYQFIGVALMYAVWLVATDYWVLIVFGLMFGAFYGGYVALLPAVAADYMGARNVSGILGLLYTSVGIGTFIGPVLVGEIHDQTKEYTWPLVVCGLLALVAAAVLLCLPRASGNDGAAGQN
jgi:MFS family permease